MLGGDGRDSPGQRRGVDDLGKLHVVLRHGIMPAPVSQKRYSLSRCPGAIAAAQE
jgi:hypothetical protein